MLSIRLSHPTFKYIGSPYIVHFSMLNFDNQVDVSLQFSFILIFLYCVKRTVLGSVRRTEANESENYYVQFAEL